MINGNPPRGADFVVVTVRTEDPEPVTDGGEKELPVPAGRPLTLNVTLPINPFIAATVTAKVMVEPRCTVRIPGQAPIEKSPQPLQPTASATEAVRTKAPLVPVMVSV